MTGFLARLWPARRSYASLSPLLRPKTDTAALDQAQADLEVEIAVQIVQAGQMRRFRSIAGFRAQQEALTSGRLRRWPNGRIMSREDIARQDAALAELALLGQEMAVDAGASGPACDRACGRVEGCQGAGNGGNGGCG